MELFLFCKKYFLKMIFPNVSQLQVDKEVKQAIILSSTDSLSLLLTAEPSFLKEQSHN